MASSQVASHIEIIPEKSIDREKICPLLLRIFTSEGRHNPLAEYGRGSVPANELQIYTWPDCTLHELMVLIKDVNVDSRRRGTEFHFAIVSPDLNTPRYEMRDVGRTVSGVRGGDDAKTLAQAKFEVGDFIDVSIVAGTANDRGGGRIMGNGSGSGGGARRMGHPNDARPFGGGGRFRD